MRLHLLPRDVVSNVMSKDQFEYAPQGLIGLLTPQGNQTVEPEFGVLVPPDIGVLTARMTGPEPDMARRLRDASSCTGPARSRW